MWISIVGDGLNYEQEDALIGRDLWLCIDGRALGGYYLSGNLGRGFYVNSGRKAAEVGELTHYWPREYPPPPPMK
jgi:hypothetical protein